MSFINIIYNIILIISIIVLFLLYFYYNNYTQLIKNNIFNFNINNEYDTILQHNSSGLTIDGVYQTINYYNPDIIYISNINLSDQIVSFESKSNYDTNVPIKETWTNNKITINNSMIEFFTNNDYIGLNRKKYTLVGEIIQYYGEVHNWMFVLPIMRYIDNKYFFLVTISQSLTSYTDANSYVGLIELILALQKNYANKEFIILGSFNVHGYEDVFNDMFTKNTINILKCKYTTNDENGLASTSGIVISNNLYKGMEYAVDFFNGFTIKDFVIKAKLYINKNIGIIDKTSDNFLKYIDNVIANGNPKIIKSEYSYYDRNPAVITPITNDIKNVNKNLITNNV